MCTLKDLYVTAGKRADVALERAFIVAYEPMKFQSDFIRVVFPILTTELAFELRPGAVFVPLRMFFPCLFVSAPKITVRKSTRDW